MGEKTTLLFVGGGGRWVDIFGGFSNLFFFKFDSL